MAYACILGTPSAELLSEYSSLRNPRKLKTTPLKLYRDDASLKLNITVTLQTLQDKSRTPTRRVMLDSRPTERGHGMMMNVARAAKRLPAFHSANIFYLENLRYCACCKKDRNEECGMWADICSRIPYRPLKRSRRLFFGKKQLLVKSRPSLVLTAALEPLESRNRIPREELLGN
jgi:hypothetical protein